MYAHSIRECIKSDIADYHAKNRPNETLDFLGQINTSKMGRDQCHHFFCLLVENPTENLDEALCKKTLKSFARGAVIRGAYINQGLNTFDADS